MMAKGGYIYIVSNKNRTVLYIGVTSNLYNRAYEHKYGQGFSFTRKYYCTDLIYYEFHPLIGEAIKREKQLKKWKRAWKEEIIKQFNPTSKDLFSSVKDFQ